MTQMCRGEKKITHRQTFSTADGEHLVFVRAVLHLSSIQIGVRHSGLPMLHTYGFDVRGYAIYYVLTQCHVHRCYVKFVS